jgi:hypothetical protein
MSDLGDLSLAAPVPADSVSVADSGTFYTATDVEGVLAEIAPQLGGGISPTSPDDIADLEMWLNADDLDASLADGDPVDTWADASGNSNDATQSGSARPTFKTSIINGHDIVRFDATDDGMETPLSLTHPFSIFYVAFYNGSSTQGRIIQGNVTNWLLGPYSGVWQWFDASAFATPLGVTGAVWVAHGVTQNATVGTHFLINDLASAGVWPWGYEALKSSRPAPTAIGAVALGRAGAFAEGNGFDLAEVVCYSRELTLEEGQGLMAYFASRYGA